MSDVSPRFRRFVLYRMRDVSGVSGTGVVAYGCQFPDGRVAIRWASKGLPASTVTWDSIADAVAVHGHDGNTIVTYVDPDPDGDD
jgi:hypothetical protein